MFGLLVTIIAIVGASLSGVHIIIYRRKGAELQHRLYLFFEVLENTYGQRHNDKDNPTLSHGEPSCYLVSFEKFSRFRRTRKSILLLAFLPTKVGNGRARPHLFRCKDTTKSAKQQNYFALLFINALGSQTGSHSNVCWNPFEDGVSVQSNRWFLQEEKEDFAGKEGEFRGTEAMEAENFTVVK